MALTKIKLNTGMVSGSLPDANIPDDLTINSAGITQSSGTLTIKNAGSDSNGLKIFQDSGDASKIYNHYNGTLQLGVGSTTALTIDSSERVGIGVLNPAYPLDVRTSSGTASLQVRAPNDADARIRLIADNQDDNADNFQIIHTASDNDIEFQRWNGSAWRSDLIIESSGNLGLGVSPNAPLQFSNDADTRKIVLYEGANNDYQFYGFGIEGSTLVYSTYTTSDDHVFFAGASSSSRNELMRIGGSGRVGIGGTPTDKFQINYDANFYDVFNGAGNWTTKRGNGSTGGLVLATDLSSGSWGSGGGYIEFKPKNSTAMKITGDGSVGIGTTANLGKLSVNSGISSSSIDNAITIHQATNGADKPAVGFGVVIQNGGESTNAGDLTISTASGGSLGERLRITSGGNVLIGTTSTVTTGSEGIELRGDFGYFKTARNNTGNVGHWNIYNPNGEVGSVTTVGSSTSFNTSSDYRLKENEVLISDGLTRLNQLKPYRFNFIADADTTVDGFFAHEVAEVVPEAITGEKDAVDDDGSIKPQSIDQSKLVPLLVKALQEADDKIDALTARIEVLENA